MTATMAAWYRLRAFLKLATFIWVRLLLASSTTPQLGDGNVGSLFGGHISLIGLPFRGIWIGSFRR